ncbi:hypothetical protein B6D52_01715 [Candidatus Parcubacteria bacterium 4484_255]|nr:MAG: hypothetical protein B6D52_01715 [Candidatus Parcubacteria bacterium 4484_255]
MVNLLPEEMKKGGDEDDKGFDDFKKERKKTENIAMTIPIKDRPTKKEKKTKVSLRPWGFILKKIKKSKESQEKRKAMNVKKGGRKAMNVKKEEEKRREEEISGGFGVSLMPQQTMIISRVVRSRLLFLIVAIVVISVLFFVSRLYGNWHFDKLKSRVEYLKREIVLLEAQTAPLLKERDNIAFLANKAAEVKKVLKNHIYWTNFFDLLETYTVPDVYFGDFSAQAGESIRLMATSRDLVSLAQQIVAFNNAPDFIKEVNVSNIQKTEKGATAFFDLILVEDVWQR